MTASVSTRWWKVFIYTHRWMGIVGGLLFVTWFISGVAMMYWGMPSLTNGERLAALPALDLSSARLEPADAARAAGITPSTLRVGMYYDGRPVYRFQDRVTVYADSGEIVRGASDKQAIDMVRRFEPAHAATVRYDRLLESSDQWTLSVAHASQLPLHRIAVGDEAGTYYYVSQLTGEPVQQTTRQERFRGFVSGVLHYVYIPPLKRRLALWDAFIVWGSLAGCVMCLSGLAVGVWRLSPSSRFRHKGVRSHTPYAGWMAWHHYTGLVFGLVTFTWMLSGALSINPYGWFSNTGPTPAQRGAVTGGPVNFDSVTLAGLRSSLAAFSMQDPVSVRSGPSGSAFAPRELDVDQFRGELYVAADQPGSPARRGMVWLDRPEAGVFTRFDDNIMIDIAREAMPAVTMADAVWLNAYDDYYYSSDGARALPVLRVRYADAPRTWLYLDPQRGTIAASYDRSARLRRWLYNGLHSFDLAWFREHRVVRDVLMILLSIGGLALSATTLWPSFVRLRRHARHFSGRLAPTAAGRRTLPAPQPLAPRADPATARRSIG
jgi:hypothetical protein